MGVAIDTRADRRRFLDGGFDGYRLVFVESPSNPGLDICDIAAVADAAHKAGAIVVADNTTMTPYGQRPLDLGADAVVAADTKAPSGHSDVLFGHVTSRNPEIIAAVEGLAQARPARSPARSRHGWSIAGWRRWRSASTACARRPKRSPARLAGHRAVGAVRYPGLPDDPAHNLARVQMDRFGFLIGLTLASEQAAEAFINGCALIQPATSFGGVHTSAERRARWGDAVAPGYVRLSVGCEPVEELWKAIAQSLDSVRLL